MSHPAFLRLPLETLANFSHDGRVFRSFDHLILTRPEAEALAMVAGWWS